MSDDETARDKRLLNEFVAWFNADELPDLTSDDGKSYVLELARDSGRRLGRGGADAVAAQLRSIANDRAHPMLRRILDATMYDWYTDDADWAIMQQILSAMAEAARGAAAGE